MGPVIITMATLGRAMHASDPFRRCPLYRCGPCRAVAGKWEVSIQYVGGIRRANTQN